MGGTDVSFGLSGSGSATSGLTTNYRTGDINVGAGLPKWTIPLAIVMVFVFSIVWVLRK